MNQSELSTEEKIKKVALDIFVQKGFDGTRTRDIAEAAGINIAAMHYYYGSKEKLFEIVIKEAMQRFSKGMDNILDGETPLHIQIKKFVEYYIDFLKENPYIPLFIISEAHTNLDKIEGMMNTQKTLDKLKLQLESLAQQGIIRSIHPAQFIANLVSLTVFPFIAKPMLMAKIEVEPEAFNRILEERKNMIPAMIINYLYIHPPG